MSTIENQDEGAVETDAGEEPQVDTVSIPKADYEKLNQTLGSLKRELKDLKKPKEPEATPSPSQKKSDIDFGKLSFYNLKPDVVRITHDDDIAYLQSQMEETGKSMDEILRSGFFQGELKNRQTAREVVQATPTVSRRGTPQVDPLEIAYARYQQTGKLPDDPSLRIQVVNKRQEYESRIAQSPNISVVEG